MGTKTRKEAEEVVDSMITDKDRADLSSKPWMEDDEGNASSAQDYMRKKMVKAYMRDPRDRTKLKNGTGIKNPKR